MRTDLFRSGRPGAGMPPEGARAGVGEAEAAVEGVALGAAREDGGEGGGGGQAGEGQVGADALAAGRFENGDAADVEDGAVGGGDGGADGVAVEAGQEEGQAGDPQAGLRGVDGARGPAGGAAGEGLDAGALEQLDVG